MAQQFHTIISEELMKKVKSHGIKYNRIVQLGIEYLEQRAALQEELEDLRRGNAKLQKVVSSQGARILQLETQEEKKNAN